VEERCVTDRAQHAYVFVDTLRFTGHPIRWSHQSNSRPTLLEWFLPWNRVLGYPFFCSLVYGRRRVTHARTLESCRGSHMHPVRPHRLRRTRTLPLPAARADTNEIACPATTAKASIPMRLDRRLTPSRTDHLLAGRARPSKSYRLGILLYAIKVPQYHTDCTVRTTC
jgi:hypothetical protein